MNIKPLERTKSFDLLNQPRQLRGVQLCQKSILMSLSRCPELFRSMWVLNRGNGNGKAGKPHLALFLCFLQKFTVEPGDRSQLAVCALLKQASFVQDNDLSGKLNGRKTMGDDNGGATH